MIRLLAVLSLCLIAAPSWAASLVLDGKTEQGGLIIGHAAPGATVTLDGQAVAVDKDGTFTFGFGRDAKVTAALNVRWPDGSVDSRTLSISKRDWPVQRIDGLPKRQVTPDPEALKRIKADNRAIGQARAMMTLEAFFQSGFIKPTEGPLSGVFGSQRILNGQPRSPHSGTDIAAPTGTPVVATADGVISLVHEDMFYTGQTVMIDHGHGIQSVYAHLSAITVVDGQVVRQGETIGAVGATGRVTGAHLHWGISWKSTKLDPMSVLTAFPAPQTAEAAQ